MIWLLTLSLTTFVQPDGLKYSHLVLPAHGTLHQGRLYCFKDEPLYPYLLSFDAKAPALVNRKTFMPLYSLNDSLPYWFRHRIRGNRIWLGEGPLAGIQQLSMDDLHFFDQRVEGAIGATAYFKKRNLPFTAKPDLIPLPRLHNRVRDLGLLGGLGLREDFPAGFGTVPIGESEFKSFLLLKNKTLEIWDTQVRYNPKKFRWEVHEDGRRFEKMKSPFGSDFYAFTRADEFYFVTQSGKLFVAPPAKKGEKSRKMEALWDDAERPITAIIEDADHNKVWLFAQHKKDAKRGYYFEMKSQTQAETFDPAKLKRVNIEGRAGKLLEYLPLIRPAKKAAPRKERTRP